jgi:hypothetical protein
MPTRTGLASASSPRAFPRRIRVSTLPRPESNAVLSSTRLRKCTFQESGMRSALSFLLRHKTDQLLTCFEDGWFHQPLQLRKARPYRMMLRMASLTTERIGWSVALEHVVNALLGTCCTTSKSTFANPEASMWTARAMKVTLLM